MIVETRAIVKHYRSTIAVDGLDLAVPQGCICGFLGANGSGKTTTIKMLLGLVRPTSGEAFVFGAPVSEESACVEVRRRIGYVSEDKRLYPFMTAAQILDFTRPLFPSWNREREQDLLSRFQLSLAQKFKTFSKGMRTKLALVLALARSPELLLLDEPSEGLDPLASEHMLEALVQAAGQGATILFSSHQIEEVERIADRVFVIHNGRRAIEGSLDDLRESWRRIHFAFPGRAPAEEMSLTGVRNLHAEGHVISLLAESNLEGITRRAHELGAISTDVQPVSLRELYLESVTGGAS